LTVIQLSSIIPWAIIVANVVYPRIWWVFKKDLLNLSSFSLFWMVNGDIPVLRIKPFSPQSILCVKIILSGRSGGVAFSSTTIKSKSSCSWVDKIDEKPRKNKMMIFLIILFKIFYSYNHLISSIIKLVGAIIWKIEKIS